MNVLVIGELASHHWTQNGLPRFGWQAWSQAADWAAQNNIDLDGAMAWADRSIGMNRNVSNLTTKALLLEKKGNAAEAEKLRAEAFNLATEGGAHFVRLPAAGAAED